MRFIFSFFFIVSGIVAKSQLLSWTPDFTTEGGSITITMDANYGNKGLLNYTPADVYVHTGVITNLSTSSTNWRYVKFNQNFNQPNAALQAIPVQNEPNKWRFTIANVREYYGVPISETIQKISILFRSGSGSSVQRNADGSDMYIPVYAAGLQVKLSQPFRQPTFNPIVEPIIKATGESVAITGKASQTANMRLFFNGIEVASQAGVTTISANPVIAAAGNQRIIAEGESGGNTKRDTIDFFITPTTIVEPLPAGVKDGINYNTANTSATLVLYAPNKSSIGVIGDFNNWVQSPTYQMKRTPDGLRYWLTINDLVPGQEYAYQYVIDGNLKVADYNSEKVLDPWNDQFINQTYTDKYPNLKPYPAGKTEDIVSVLEPGKLTYNWSNATTFFQRPDKRNIIVYELLLRDFLARNDWKTLRDTLGYISRLGVNTIHLMPFNEFEGNNSWGYNPSFMFAVDKFYGPENQLKEFIDSCHGRGIAVVMDMVLNHQFGQSPMVRMYWDATTNKPAVNSPWFNADAKHPFNVGYDMNHEAPATIDFVQRVMEHWLTKFKLDGFRWDLSKGFTQTNNPNNADAWSQYDASRVAIWNRIYDQSQVISPNCYMILEHLGVDQEEVELAKKGMLLWGKMTNEFNEASMGYLANSNFQRAYHTNRWSGYTNGSNTPHLMAYAESHDEERLAFKNVRFGNQGSGLQNTRLLSEYTKRLQSVAAFLFTIPGPKMLWQFGELAYDSSINMCENLTISNDCRLAPKPTAWAMPGGNYNANTFRLKLRNTYSRVLSLRTKYPAFVPTFVSSDLFFSLGGGVKWQWVRSNQLTVLTVGNFDVVTQSNIITFPAAGTWYVYTHNVENTGGGDPFTSINPGLTATSITVTEGALARTFNVQPGMFLIFTSKDVNLQTNIFTFTGNGNWSNPANWENGNLPPTTLTSGGQIIINPTEGGEAVMDVNVTIQPGATFTVIPGKRFRLLGNLIRQ